ncbi:ABC transporter permease [Pseudogemmobacter sonorensis]|uniref:ABC transporter permease n=1 Tax=Pseudogemmobacter sonorensis TaxID=2989681 RepID=UPI0036B71971
MLLLPALVVGIGTCLPAAYLVLRAFDAEPSELAAIVFRPRNLWLFGNTLKLVAVVLGIGTLIALPMAWLVTRSDLRHRGVVSFLMALPLAIPGYVMAYALLGLSGYYGFARQWFGLSLPPLHGLWGAGLALALYTFPYLFLNLRAAFLGMDPALEESAQSLGQSRLRVFRHIVLPQLWPALVASWLIVGLYVIGDFGAIALMRYEVFSFAIYTQYSGAFDRTYAAWLSLMLLALTVTALLGQRAVTRNRRFARTGTGVARAARPVALGRWRWPVRAGIAMVVLASVGLPLLVLGHWMRLGLPAMDWGQLGRSALRTAGVAGPVAALAVALALPVTVLVLRWPGPLSALVDRLAYMGYATPSLAFALAMVMFVLQVAPALYQSWLVLVFACTMSFLVLAFGPIRLALMQIGTRQEEAARALGATPSRAFLAVVLPRLRRPMLAGALLVFIMVVKELPITLLLAPTGYTTLSMNVFARTAEGMMREAAPYALSVILFASLFVGLILKYEARSTPSPSQGRPT